MLLKFILIFFSLYFPSILYQSFDISPDFLLLLIVLISIEYDKNIYIFITFLIGLTKDFLIQYSWFGLLTILTSIFGYILIYIIEFNNMLIKYISFIFLLLVYFYFYFLFQFSGSFIFYLKLSIMKTLTTIIAYGLIDFTIKKRYNYFGK